MIDLIKLRELARKKVAEKQSIVNKSINIDFKQIFSKKQKPLLIKEDDNIFETDVTKVSRLISPSLPKINTLIFAKADDDYVWLGRKDINLHNLIESKVKCSKVYDFGGTIINAKGDICIGFISREKCNFGKDFTKWLQEYLLEKNINTTIDNNDLLIDNRYKVASWTFRKYNNYFIYLAHVSINLNLELIKTICTKKTRKIPAYLSKYGITYNDVKNLIISKSKENYIK